MKKMLLPAIFAVLAGVCSATAATFVNAKKTATLHAAFLADSVEKHVKDSTAASDSLEKEAKNHEAEHAAEGPLTPADSIRAAHNEPTTLTAATKDVHDAPDPKHGAAAPATAHAAAPDAHAAASDEHAPVPAGHDAAPAPKNGAAASKGKTIVPRAVDAPKAKPAAREAASHGAAPASNAPAAIEEALPEGRIAKIFSGMGSKDAAKILEQMNDSDVRVILSKMNDKQAAAILVAFPAARAAAISRGDSKVDTGKAAAKSDTSKAKPAGEHK